jgi:predicted GNAT family N-acyltransferase
MGLPAYMLEQPKTNPIESIAGRMERLGVPVELNRLGAMITMRNLDGEEAGHDVTRKAIRMVCEHADASRVTIEAFIPSVLAGCVGDYESCGFHVVLHADEEDMAGAHYVMRRAARQ